MTNTEENQDNRDNQPTLIKTERGSFHFSDPESNTVAYYTASHGKMGKQASILTTSAKDYTREDDKRIATTNPETKVTHNHPDHKIHEVAIHMHGDPFHDKNHGHISYDSPQEMIAALKHRSPDVAEKYQEILKNTKNIEMVKNLQEKVKVAPKGAPDKKTAMNFVDQIKSGIGR